jgi:hypothetical protein
VRLWNIVRTAVGVAVSNLSGAPGRDHRRPAGDRAPLPPTWLPRLLALEVPPRRRAVHRKQVNAPDAAGHGRKVGRTFLRNHAAGIASLDVFVVRTI